MTRGEAIAKEGPGRERKRGRRDGGEKQERKKPLVVWTKTAREGGKPYGREWGQCAVP